MVFEVTFSLWQLFVYAFLRNAAGFFAVLLVWLGTGIELTAKRIELYINEGLAWSTGNSRNKTTAEPG